MASPFFDADASALRWLIENFSPERLTLLVDDEVHLDPARMGEALEAMGDGGSVRRFWGEGRPLHGKLLLFKGRWGEALLTGSPNVSSAALLKRAGRGSGNFEIAVFRYSPNGDFSALLEDKVGEPTSLRQISSSRPYLLGPRIAPLELEAAWVSEGVLFALPAEKMWENPEHIELLIERDGAEIATLRLCRQEEGGVFLNALTDEERLRLEGGPSRAYLLGAAEELGPPVWVQNLDAVEKRANPVQRPRYSKGLQALTQGSLGPYQERWDALFEVFSAFSNSWLRYTEVARPKSTKPREREEGSQQDWDPDLFYISRDEVTLELPRYFAKVENSGVAIGDFEHLISALPSARRPASAGTTYEDETGDALVNEEDEEGEDEQDEEATAPEEEAALEITEAQLEWLRKRLYTKFRSIIREYEDALSKAPVENLAEASYLCLPYRSLHKAIMVSSREGFLDVWQLRELSSRLTAAWTMKLWKSAPQKEELEDKVTCAATSLAAIATVTAPWLRELAGSDEFDYELYKQLREPLKELRPMFVSLEEAYEAGEERREWSNLIEEYNELRHVELDKEYFAAWTPLQVLDDLARRYKVWELEEAPLWERTAEKLGIEGSVRCEGGVLRIRAELPHVSNHLDFLRKLLYSIHGGVDKPAAVVWENSALLDRIREIALILCPAERAALEITYYGLKRSLIRRHYFMGGSSGGTLFLSNARTIPFKWYRRQAYPADEDQEALFECAAGLAPELPIASNPLGDDRRLGRS